MKTYAEIKAELLEIADVLKKYSENIQPQVFDILIKNFIGSNSILNGTTETPSPEVVKGGITKNPKPPRRASGAKEIVSLVKDLNLRAPGNKSFKDFNEEKKPNTAFEFNTVAVYYMTDILQVSGITPNHIFTCYKEVSKRPPEAFIQSLRDTASKQGFIDTAETGNIKLLMRGRNLVEHDLPRQKTIK